MRFSEDWPIAPTLPTTIVIAASAANAGAQVVAAPISATSKSRRITPNAAALVATAMNAGDRRRRALVDVRRPLVERRDRGLEREADEHDSATPVEEQHVVATRRAAQRAAMPAKSVEPVAP